MENLCKDERYRNFTKELEVLSKCYGVILDADVLVVDALKDIENIEYDDDWQSGDLKSKVKWKNKKNLG
tara:strand:- start:858 stop:1064 length:207 start_codon:yes stop_codon:yes gene_type:complete